MSSNTPKVKLPLRLLSAKWALMCLIVLASGMILVCVAGMLYLYVKGKWNTMAGLGISFLGLMVVVMATAGAKLMDIKKG